MKLKSFRYITGAFFLYVIGTFSLSAQDVRVTNATSCTVDIDLYYDVHVACGGVGYYSATINAGSFHVFTAPPSGYQYVKAIKTTGPSSPLAVDLCGTIAQTYNNCNARSSKIYFNQIPGLMTNGTVILEEP